MEKVVRNTIEYKVYGKYALFSDIVTKIGGEKMSYPIPTYQALKGITESIYWKPTIIWYIDEVRILNPISMDSKGIRTIKYNSQKDQDLSFYSYLTDVAYQVRAHFEFNPHRPELLGDQDENKHHNIAKRMVAKGGRRDIFLGTRECQGYVEAMEFGSGKGHYDDSEEITFGLMLHGLNYPDETGKDMLQVRMWQPVMKNGVIRFIRPQECKIVRDLHELQAKLFTMDDICSAE
ncbi:MAG: type I-C CRISPR-associated protein Cas5c [Peptostreptococcaceae bacterium]|nr:type I-C CRISPR-associated protein Cas5c [Peptostreptococcaceae bacterium]